MSKLLKGCVVSSRQGRDVNKFYVVWSVDYGKGNVLLVNGDKRTINRPKEKNLRHIMPTNTVFAEDVLTTDLKIKTNLRAFEAKINKENAHTSLNISQEEEQFV